MCIDMCIGMRIDGRIDHSNVFILSKDLYGRAAVGCYDRPTPITGHLGRPYDRPMPVTSHPGRPYDLRPTPIAGHLGVDAPDAVHCRLLAHACVRARPHM